LTVAAELSGRTSIVDGIDIAILAERGLSEGRNEALDDEAGAKGRDAHAGNLAGIALHDGVRITRRDVVREGLD
jgi:hypothetical protein